ncbi:hypothetical protein MNEG_3835 [Monoraphidium neglectum]|uniref:EF-hand domain-containing protein n=1 Tax=Monoraphidium neglectum TaxID=145388 RepID=A0A0D2MN26_9CHLO|nr:hypothetical protein MNEG_3835 [Monoraphidium neglectum]KIZ04125.1 hypothetical protein MNEG_3835 [Monoraphidium neglectum]|eukprot:XP_013903144.1 hypothetical protein MNEG_3835 [Monoraphidium neglectum]
MPLSSHGQPALASAPAKPSAAAKTCGGSAGGVVALTADKYAQPAAAQRSSAKTLLGTTLRQSAIAAPVNAVKSVFDRAPKLRSHNSFADPLDANKGNVVMGADCVNTSQATGAPTTGPCKGVADVEAAAGVGGAERSWLSNVFKLLFTHLQMLGLLRGIRMDWPDGLDKVLGFLDQTQAFSTWVSLECSLAGVGLHPSITRSIILLLMPAAACLVGLLGWIAIAAVTALWQRHQGLLGHEHDRVTWDYYRPRVLMTCIMVAFFLYPQVSDAVVTILAACTTVDNHSAVSPAYLPPRNATSPGGDALAALKAVGTYWNYDTSQMCFEGPMRVLLVMGIMWVVAFCAGFPLVMVLVLWMNRERLGEVKTDLMYGFFYDSYRHGYYFWESVLLLEKLLLSLAITVTTRYGAPAQVLAGHCVIFVALMLQVKCRPYGCQMLDRLQGTSLYALVGSCFALMMPALDSILTGDGLVSQSSAVTGASLAIAGVLNVGVVLLFLCALYLEGRRMVVSAMDADGDGKVAVWEVLDWVAARLPPWLKNRLAATRNATGS